MLLNIRGVKCCNETLILPSKKEQDMDWYYSVYWPFSRRHSPAGPNKEHHWKFALENEDGKIEIQHGK